MAEKLSESTVTHVKSKIKAVFLGDQSTGKTSILLRYLNQKFEETQGPTVGIDFMAKNMTVNNIQLRLQLWDTAGQERFRSLIPSYLKDATLIFIVFDLSNHRSFENIREWIELCHHNRREKSVMLLVGNKSDLTQEREVTQMQIREKQKQQGIPYFQVSAKNDVNIQQIFEAAGKKYIQLAFVQQPSIINIESIHEGFISNMEKKRSSSFQGEPKNQPIFSQKNKSNVILGNNGAKSKNKNKRCC